MHAIISINVGIVVKEKKIIRNIIIILFCFLCNSSSCFCEWLMNFIGPLKKIISIQEIAKIPKDKNPKIIPKFFIKLKFLCNEKNIAEIKNKAKDIQITQ